MILSHDCHAFHSVRADYSPRKAMEIRTITPVRISRVFIAAIAVLCRSKSTHGLSANPRIQYTPFMSSSETFSKKGKILVLGGTGFLGQTICKRATLEGYSVVSLSRRGLPSKESSFGVSSIDYRQGDARQKEAIASILSEGDFRGM